jgi:DNA-directed RNA polymerase II subunit RPB2
MESLSEQGLVFLEKYFSENDFALTRHHIDSYEHCIFNEIPTIIKSTNPIVFLKEPLDKDKTVFAYRVEIFIGDRGISISSPVVSLDSGETVRRLFPNEARLRNMTYAAQVNADIQVRITFTRPKESGGFTSEVKDAPPIVGFPLFRMPILLRSKLCATSVADPVLLEEMGECRNDYGGYFIVGGAEKVLITRGEQAFNSLYVEKKASSDDKVAAYASVVSLHPETKQTRRVALYLTRVKYTDEKKGAHGGEIRVAVPMIRGAFPLFILFRALGYESDEEIVQMIFPDVADPLKTDLIPSIEDAYPIYNRYTAIKYIMTLTKGFTEAHVLDILQNLMLPHVPEEARGQYLAEMARAAIQANAGQRPKTDRDDMRNQRFLPTGTLVRELFNGCWKDWRAAVALTIDRTYRSNEQLYVGDALFDLFGESNRMAMFQPAELDKAIMRGFRGRWGTNPRNEKPGVIQPLARISYLDAMSHVRRVVSDFDTGSKVTGPRKLHTSQIGYFCTSETPTGGHIGATKNMSMMTQFSIGASMKPVYDWMRIKGGLIPVAETTAAIRFSAAVVQINGGTVGFTMDPVGLTRVLKLMKWTACLSPTASVSFNTSERTVRILLDEGRPIRPLWHLSDGLLERLPELLTKSWSSLVFGTYPATAGAKMRSVRFLDPLADRPDATFADYEAELAGVAGSIEYCDPVEMNEAYISWWGADFAGHTHAEIHPSTLTGLLASMIPYSNHNQSPRNQLSCSQSKQGIGTMATNIGNRYDTYSHQLCYGEAPICRTFMYEAVGGGQMPYGFNCIIAASAETGYNQDDGLIINRDSVARGMFQSMSFRAYDCEEEVDTRTKVHTHIANPSAVPSWTALKPGLDYSKLDERGIIRVGEIVDDHTVLVGRYMVLPDSRDIKDASTTPGLFTQGRVDSVVVLHQNAEEGQSRLLVKVRIIEMRIPQLGDKFSSRHGQKGTIGMFVSAADLPRTAEGIVPDVMVNPGGLISRMTVAQLVEMVAGLLGATVAAKLNATTFCNGGDFVRQLGDVLEAVGCSRTGDNVLYSGLTGAQIRTNIFMCPLYFMRLKHLTDDKVNARGAGKREIRTHQPTGGRGNEGGLRIGEMERDSLCAHGVSTFLQESMMKRGDATTFWVCNGCGRIPIYNESEDLFVCSTCDGPIVFNGITSETLTMQLPTIQSRATFSRVAMPYTLKLLDQELTTFANTGFRFITGASIARLRESDWAWPAVDVDFKAEVREAEAEAVNPAAAAVAAAAAAPEEDVGAKPVRKPAASASVKEEASVVEDAMAIRFSNKLVNDYSVFATYAPTPFRITGPQIPGVDGTVYPEMGVAENGSVDAGQQTWPTVEHYFQAMKFPLDKALQEEIRQAPTVIKAKQLGAQPDHPMRGDWEKIKDQVMKTALLAKYRQNPAALSLLLGTEDRRLIESSKVDTYWGAGIKGKGLNRLGALLTEVRTELKNERPDMSTSASSEADGSSSGSSASGSSASEEIVAEAEGAAEAAVASVKQIGGGGNGGVYLFINPAPQGGIEPRARHARNRGAARNLSWEGMGGGGDEQLTTETGNTTEVTVQKLE